MNTVHPLRAWRKDNGKTLIDVAGAVVVQPSHLSEIERGVNRPSPSLAAKLSALTGIPMRDLLPDLAALFNEAAE